MNPHGIFLQDDHEDNHERQQKRSLFLSFNVYSMTGEHVFTFSLAIEQEARNMIAHFGSYLAHKYSLEIFSCMQAKALERAKQSPWDPETHIKKTRKIS